MICESFSQFQEELHRTSSNSLYSYVRPNCREKKKKGEKIVIILRNSLVHICINSLTILPSFLLHYSCNSRKGKTFWCGPPGLYDVGRSFEVKGTVSDFIQRAASKNVLQSWELLGTMIVLFLLLGVVCFFLLKFC